jgi:hypothetical protein
MACPDCSGQVWLSKLFGYFHVSGRPDLSQERWPPQARRGKPSHTSEESFTNSRGALGYDPGGIDEPTASTLVAEMAAKVDQFPIAGHAAKWSGICPGNK